MKILILSACLLWACKPQSSQTQSTTKDLLSKTPQGVSTKEAIFAAVCEQELNIWKKYAYKLDDCKYRDSLVLDNFDPSSEADLNSLRRGLPFVKTILLDRGPLTEFMKEALRTAINLTIVVPGSWDSPPFVQDVLKEFNPKGKIELVVDAPSDLGFLAKVPLDSVQLVAKSGFQGISGLEQAAAKEVLYFCDEPSQEVFLPKKSSVSWGEVVIVKCTLRAHEEWFCSGPSAFQKCK